MGAIIDSDLLIQTGELEDTGGPPDTQIRGYDSMEPFLMTLVSDTDLWMYISSLGSLTAGRVDEDHSIFPYCVEDIVHRSAGRTGPTTTIRIWRENGGFDIWEPFAGMSAPEGTVRILSKSVLSNRISFSERHEKLGLTFRYRWASCDRFGFVRTAELINDGREDIRVEIVDGLLNLLPAGISYGFLQRMSVLVDAYTESEIDPATGVATISLASLIVDRPEPGEALKATVVWSRGLDDTSVLLTENQLPGFRRGAPVAHEFAVKGRRADYLLSASLTLAPGESRSWDIVADANRSQCDVEELRAFLMSGANPRLALAQHIEAAAENLAKFVCAADGQPCTADGAADLHQQASVLFNIMRGGIYASGDRVSSRDFYDFVSIRNRSAAVKHRDWIQLLPQGLAYGDLLAAAELQSDATLTRLAFEYLPLTFSRRHGDPSRPWNRFAIRLRNPDGSPLLAYQGNWRDILQNWEALSLSFPMFIESIVAKFVNGSTVDGYNPYRITREGVEWEVPDPDDPWTSMGYWGDHQIIYLLKFLEQSKQMHPEALPALLNRKLFSYANVPIRLRDYAAMVEDPHSTLDFDLKLNTRIEESISKVGTDARLVVDSSGAVYHVTLAEKLLVPALSKLSNLVVDGGIWMNTQRPEWNDANNALVGNGVSMVTLCYLRRYLAFCRKLFHEHPGPVEVSAEVADWLIGVSRVLEAHHGILNGSKTSDEDRRMLLDELGRQFSDYRRQVYSFGFSGQQTMDSEEAIRLCDAALPYLDHSIRAGKRADGLYHAYNLLDLREPGRAAISHLYEMLEGQVAVLSTGVLCASEVATLIDALFESKMYRSDRRTFMLYPDRRLPGFLEKNVIPEEIVQKNALLQALPNSGDVRIVVVDAFGRYRFAPSLRNASALAVALDELAGEPQWADRVAQHRGATLEAYEAVFGHRHFTGRSGAMYAYEGLGSIYWHMVSKLLVAVQESFFQAEEDGAPPPALRQIAAGYYRIRAGMGFNKTPEEFGAFPADPYSHTPAGRGAKQPGMTGQTKEDILSRWMEFGVMSRGGRLEFRTSMLRRHEFLMARKTWQVRGLDGNLREIELTKGSLGFTVSGVPVVYQLGQVGPQTTVTMSDGTIQIEKGTRLSAENSQDVYARSGKVKQITVALTDCDILSP